MRFDLKTIAERIGGRLDGPGDLLIERLAGIEGAREGDLSYVGSPRYEACLATTGASAVIVSEELECHLPCVRAADPSLAFVRALHLFAVRREELFPPGVHDEATVHESAEVGEGVHVGARAVIGPGCRLGDRCVVAAGSVLVRNVTVGEDSLLYPNVSVLHGCIVGRRCTIHSGAVIGSDGFGFSREADAVHKIPQVGIVRLGDDVEVGANACIDRATAGETIIGNSVKIDNLVQIAHNVQIGDRTAISAQTGVSGSTRVGRDVIMAGQVGLADHMSVGDGVTIGAKSGLHGHVAAGRTVSGIPARDHRDWMRMNGHLARLERYAREIAELKRRVEELEAGNE
jgi:UDP-3-O-[3-hydroxymyristoyl] glucosamine N-acyltransferase